jgi:hypothetical protein
MPRENRKLAGLFVRARRERLTRAITVGQWRAYPLQEQQVDASTGTSLGWQFKHRRHLYPFTGGEASSRNAGDSKIRVSLRTSSDESGTGDRGEFPDF